MSEIYKEVIVEAKKLREIAEIDARNKIIEAVTPYIKKIIAKEAAGTQAFLFGSVQEEEQPMDDPMMGDVMPPPVEEPTLTPGDMPNAAPISPSDGLVGMPMPDDEGKITVDFQQLFSMGGGDALATPPAAGDLANVNQGEILPPGPVGPGGDLGAVGGEPPPVAPVAPVGAGAPPVGPPGAETAAPGGGVAPPLPAAAGTPAPPLPGEEIPPEEQPVPPIAGESRIIRFQDDVRLVAEKIDYLYFRGSVPLLVKESLKSKLFTLCEKLDEMVNEDVISSKKARLAENKLEFLFMKLNEAEQRNSYKEIKGVPMTTLREFAAKLFEEDALGPATADKATAHAEKVSGIQPGVDLFKEGDAPAVDEVTPKDEEEEGDLKEMAEALLGEDAPASSAFGDGKAEGDAENKSPAVHNPDALAKEKGAGIVEGAPASTAYGDGVKAKGAENTSPAVHKGAALADEKGANTILEFDEKELREAVAKLRKENLSRKIAAVREAATTKTTEQLKGAKALQGTGKPKEGEWSSFRVPVGGKAPAQKELKECDTAMGVGAEAAGMPMGDDLDGGGGDMPPDMGGAEGGAGDEVELTFQIDVDDLEALLNGAAEDFVAEPAGEAADMGDGGEEEDDAGGIELVDDGDEDEQILMDTGDESPPKKENPFESRKPAAGKPGLNEAAVVARAAAAVKSLKTQLSESKLLTAKALYVSKFAVREDLTTKQKQKIAEYFDKAKTLAEAKETYTKIKKILAESATSNKLSGSASRSTSTGSARLNESAHTGGDLIEAKRWQLLAGIKAKK